MIKELPDAVKSYIRSGVAITSLTQCVEELLLNSIDAGATNVAVRVDISCFRVQVVDNGHGIPEEELPLVGNRYLTSKCHTVSDIEDLQYFGYRGEALASIKDACGILEIVTRTKTASKPLCKLFQDGKPLPIKESAIPRPSVGTTITVHALFMNFPVRQKSINEGLELEKIRQRVAGLALIKPQVSVRLRNEANGATIIHTNKCSSTLVTFASLFGQTKAQSLIEIKGTKGQFTVEGYFGKEGSTKKDIQFIYVNGRLVLKTKIHKLINQLLKKSAICRKKFDLSLVSPTLPLGEEGFQKSPGKQLDKHPMFIVDVKCPLTEYDITFDPAKTLVEFKDWDTLLQNITDLTNDFLKKEKLNLNQSDLNQENNDRAEPGESKLMSEISPSNIKDALISRPARRPGYKPNKNTKTPECLPLEQWKAENSDLTKPSVIPSSSSICDNSTNSSDTVDVHKIFCDKSLESASNTTDTETEDSNAINGKYDCDSKGVCDKSNELSKENELKIQPNVHGKSVPSNLTGGGSQSGLSLFRKSIGKPTSVVPVRGATNIDNNLERISKLLPSGSGSQGKSLSSLQRFRKYASKYSKEDNTSPQDPEKEVLPPKFCKLNDVPRIEPHDSHIIGTPCKPDDMITEKPNSLEDEIKIEKKTSHCETKEIHQVPETNDYLSRKSNPTTQDFLYQQNVPMNFQLQSYSYSKLATDESMLRNHILDSSFQFERQHMRPGLRMHDTTCLGLTDQTDHIPLCTNSSDKGFKGMTGIRSQLLDQTGHNEKIKYVMLESIENLSTKGTERKRLSTSYEEIAHKFTRLDNMNICGFDQCNKESSEERQPCVKDIEGNSVRNKINYSRLDDQENTFQACEKDSDLVSGNDKFRAVCDTEHGDSIRNTDSNNVNRGANMSPVECYSPNSVTASQLFKNLPDLEMGCSQDSNNSDMLIAVPIDTNKVIHDIIMEGLNLPENPQYGLSSQEFILGTESQEMVTEQPPDNADTMEERSNSSEVDADSEHINTTQEFTPMSTEVNAHMDNENGENSDNKKSPDKTGDHTSPGSTGFTPKLDDVTSPHICERVINKKSMSPCPKHVDVNELPKAGNGPAGDNDTQVTQDTLDMPSILERSRLDMTVTDQNISPGNINFEQESCVLHSSGMQGSCSSITELIEGSRKRMGQVENLRDDVTVSQLLDIKSCIPFSHDSQKDSDGVVTFRDIFPPTQSQTDTQSNIEKMLTNEKVTSLPEENTDGFSDTFDEDILNINSQVAEPNNEYETCAPEKGTKDSPKPRSVEGKVKQVEEWNLKQNPDEPGPEQKSSMEPEGKWIEIKHPETGKTVYVHSNLGTVVDQIDHSLSKNQPEKDGNGVPVKSVKTFQIKEKKETNLEKPEIKSVALSSLQKMFDKHLEKKGEETDVKWRDKQQKPSVESESSIAELFSDWDNPVFDNIRKPVMNVEMSNSTASKSTLKTMKTLHTCAFSKEMLKSIQVIGQLDKKFIVCLIQTDASNSDPDLLAVIDQHAAHERVRLELLTEEAYIDGNVDRAELAKFSVNPAQSIKMDPDEIQVMMSFRDEFSRIGITFRVDTHVDDMIKVLTVPECLVVKATSDVPKKELVYWDTIQTLIKGHVELLLSTEGAKGRLPNIIHKLLCSQACHGAIKFGDKLSLTDCKSLIHDLSLCDLPFQCAHGRPSVMPILQLQQLDNKLPKMQQQKPQLHKLRLAMEKRNTNKEVDSNSTDGSKKSSFCPTS